MHYKRQRACFCGIHAAVNCGRCMNWPLCRPMQRVFVRKTVSNLLIQSATRLQAVSMPRHITPAAAYRTAHNVLTSTKSHLSHLDTMTKGWNFVLVCAFPQHLLHVCIEYLLQTGLERGNTNCMAEQWVMNGMNLLLEHRQCNVSLCYRCSEIDSFAPNGHASFQSLTIASTAYFALLVVHIFMLKIITRCNANRSRTSHWHKISCKTKNSNSE